MPLVEPNEGRPIPGVKLPSEFYWVLREPAHLAGMKFPRKDFPWRAVADTGFVGVVALEPGSYDPSPLHCLFSKQLEDLCHGGDPRDPNKEKKLIVDAVAATLSALQSGRGVVVHCAGGTGRTGTVIGCVLRKLEYGVTEVVDYLVCLNRAREKHWPESPWQEALVKSFDT